MEKKQYVPYQHMSAEEMGREIEWLTNCWNSFLEINDPELTEEDYHIHKTNLQEVIERVDKRIDYYEIFHSLKRINEYKHTALYCYWIITLKPFFVSKIESPLYNSPNEVFALFMIIATIRETYEIVKKKENWTKPFEYPSPELMTDIVYNFKYTDMSREAMICFVENFADKWGVGISYIKSLPEDTPEDNQS